MPLLDGDSQQIYHTIRPLCHTETKHIEPSMALFVCIGPIAIYGGYQIWHKL